jgi:hypothetical protein
MQVVCQGSHAPCTLLCTLQATACNSGGGCCICGVRGVALHIVIVVNAQGSVFSPSPALVPSHVIHWYSTPFHPMSYCLWQCLGCFMGWVSSSPLPPSCLITPSLFPSWSSSSLSPFISSPTHPPGSRCSQWWHSLSPSSPLPILVPPTNHPMSSFLWGWGWVVLHAFIVSPLPCVIICHSPSRLLAVPILLPCKPRGMGQVTLWVYHPSLSLSSPSCGGGGVPPIVTVSNNRYLKNLLVMKKGNENKTKITQGTRDVMLTFLEPFFVVCICSR